MDNNLVYKANALIEASYSLTLNEQRLLLACISQIDSNKPLDANMPFTLNVEQARDLFYSESDRDNAYRDLNLACERLFQRDVRFKSEDETKRVLTRFISTAKFDDTLQEATLYFSVGILPYISQLKENFTRYRVENMVQLTSTHAIRVYELIVMWASQNQSYKELEIDKFKELLGLDLKYKQTGDLNKFVITPVLEQINDRTDYHLEIKLRKIGRSFQFIQLRFNRKTEAINKDVQRKKLKAKVTEKTKKLIGNNGQQKTPSSFAGLQLILLKQIQKNHPEITEKYVRDYAEQSGLDIVQVLEKIKADYKAAEDFSLEKTD
ncbi:MAG: replication initiation protein [Gammaproteobacteria bacterium]|nr:replication initiation protein [Gammaproteobacteria bacterium]